jgi:hypothetical protein
MRRLSLHEPVIHLNIGNIPQGGKRDITLHVDAIVICIVTAVTCIVIFEATRFSSVALFRHRSDTATQVCQAIAWFETQSKVPSAVRAAQPGWRLHRRAIIEVLS